MNAQPDYVPLQQCSNCERETLGRLEDGWCSLCLYPPPAQAITEYVVSLYREDGTHEDSFRFRNKSAAEKTWAWFSVLDPRRVKFETFPPAGLLPAEFHRAVRPEAGSLIQEPAARQGVSR